MKKKKDDLKGRCPKCKSTENQEVGYDFCQEETLSIEYVCNTCGSGYFRNYNLKYCNSEIIPDWGNLAETTTDLLLIPVFELISLTTGR